MSNVSETFSNTGVNMSGNENWAVTTSAHQDGSTVKNIIANNLEKCKQQLNITNVQRNVVQLKESPAYKMVSDVFDKLCLTILKDGKVVDQNKKEVERKDFNAAVTLHNESLSRSHGKLSERILRSGFELFTRSKGIFPPRKNHNKTNLLFQNERDFVEQCLQKKELMVLPNGMVKYPDGRIVEKLLKLVREYFTSFEKDLVKNIRPTFFEDLIWKIVDEQKLAHRQSVINKLGKYVPDPNNNLKKVCDLFKGCDPRLIKFAIENIIRQMKQKMNNMEVTLQLFVILVGGGHIGKTDFFRKVLLKPLQYLYTEPKLSEITDTEKHYQLFCNNFALLCEEMSGASKADIETLKHIITAPTVPARIFHTQDRVEVPNNSTLMGTSNRRIWEIIKDTVTMRRFIDIPVESIDFKSFQTIDVMALWQGVKYDLNTSEIDALFSEYNELVKPLQEDCRHRDDLEDWLEQYNVKVGRYFASYQYLYKQFDFFLSYCGKKTHLSVKAFSKLLRERHHFEHKHTNKGDGICIDFELFKSAKDRWVSPSDPDIMNSEIDAEFPF